MIDNLYRSKPSLLHAYDCRLKLILLPLGVLAFFLPLAFGAQIALGGFFFLICLAILGPADTLVPLKMIFPLIILILLLTPLFHREGRVLIGIGGFSYLTDKGLIESLVYISRFGGISYLFYLFFRSTAMDDLILGLRWFRLPYTVTLVISISLRYIPHLAGLYGQIKAAHSMRCGKNHQSAKKRGPGKIRGLFPILASLMIQSVKTIPVLTMALELKGIGRDNPRSASRTLPKPLRPGLQVITTLIMLVLFMSLLIVSV